MKNIRINVVAVLMIAFLGLMSVRASADQTSANGKYNTLIQQLYCPADQATYGGYRDYGYWGGGAWCGQTGRPGYWVWVNPTWYVWANQGAPASAPAPAQSSSLSSANGKYANLIQQLYCPADQATYGEFRDYGYWAGGPWCGQTGQQGYWVWVNPTWYVWGGVVK